MSSLRWVSGSAAALVGLQPLRRAAEPDGPLGRRLRDAHAGFGPDAQDAWHRDRAACRALAAAQPPLDRLAAELAHLEPLDDALRRVGRGDVDEADLFRIKRTLFHAYRAASDVAAACGGAYPPPPVDPEVVGAWVRGLDAGDVVRARFALADAFAPELGEARARQQAAARSAAAADRAAREAVQSRYALTFRRGEAFVAAGDARLGALRADSAVRVAAEGAGEVRLALVETEAQRVAAAELAGAEAALDEVERRLRGRLGREIAPHRHQILALLDWAAWLDFRHARVRLAERFGAWPEPAESTTATAAWLPAARQAVERDGGVFQPVDVSAPTGITLLTGPNMGGKTVALATLAAVQVLAQLGYPVPAESATFRWVSRVDYLGGERADHDAGLSSFAGEVTALRDALAGPADQLLLIDELGRATSPSEGRALAQATARYLADATHSAVLVTHFSGLDVPGARAFRIRGLADVDDAELQEDAAKRGWRSALNAAMDYSLEPDTHARTGSDGLRIARLIGLPSELLDGVAAERNPGDSDSNPR